MGPALGLWRRHTLGLGFHGGGLRQLLIQLGSIVRGTSLMWFSVFVTGV